MNGKRCNNPAHGDRDFTTAWRGNLGMLCAACYVDARNSTVKQVPVPERIENDRYAQMAARYGVK